MITARQEAILNIIVSEYIKIANPIASDQIVGHYDIGVSSATIRNDMAELEEAGYLSRPHSSAGAIPRDEAYRVYVESKRNNTTSNIPQHIQTYVKQRLLQSERDIEQQIKLAANTLSDLVGNMAISTYPRAKVSKIRHLELIPLQEFVVMLIVVLGQTKLKRQIIRFKEPIDRSQIELSGNKIKKVALGLTSKGINTKGVGSNVIATSLSFFARSIPVKFVINRLKPNTRVYVFMEGQNIARWVNPDTRYTGVAGNSLSAFTTALYNNNLEASNLILISASCSCTAWKSIIGLPNCFLS